MTNKSIKRIFDNYIAEKQDREYHSEGCLKAEEELETALDEHIKDLDTWTEVIIKAMNLANEYEQDGFIAGFKAAMQVLEATKTKKAA